MKKLFFPLFVILFAAFVSACSLNPVPGHDDSSRSSDDGGNSHPELPRYVTMRFADYGEYVSDTIGIGLGNTVSSPQANSRSESRALTHGNAQAFHDFFEAVFVYNNNGTYTVARATWDIGVTPELRGVWRDFPVNYSNIGPAPNNTGTPTPPNTRQGSAVLFVGSKADKTLLAIGRLCEVDGVPATVGVPSTLPVITTETKSVTFEVAPLQAGVSTNATSSSFKTNFRVSPNGPIEDINTVIYNDIFIHYEHGKRKFPFFLLNRPAPNNYSTNPGNPGGSTIPAGNELTKGEYKFEVEMAGARLPTYFSAYAAGIVLASKGWNCEVRNPRYLITNGLYQYSSIFVQDLRDDLVSMENPPNYTITNDGTYSGFDYFGTYQDPVKFNFKTTNSPDGSVFALVFEFFVYNLTPRPTTLDDSDPIKWRLSPGAGGTTWLDLDDGAGGTGGAILLGSGDVRAWLNNVPSYVPP